MQLAVYKGVGGVSGTSFRNYLISARVMDLPDFRGMASPRGLSSADALARAN